MSKLIHRLPLMVLCFALLDVSLQGITVAFGILDIGSKPDFPFTLLSYLFLWQIVMPLSYWILIQRKITPASTLSVLHLFVLLCLTLLTLISDMVAFELHFMIYLFSILNWLVFLINIVLSIYKKGESESSNSNNILDTDL